MPGYDDPRFLQQVIEKLQREMKDLRAQTLPFLTHQRGALPGSMRAVSIGDVGQKSAMWINLVGNQPGQAPYEAVTDATGTVRVELGNLAANGVSPAQFGWRASNAAGSPTSDTFGVISGGVMASFGIIDVVTQNFTTVAFADVTGSAINFTVPTPPGRAVNLLTLFLATGTISSQAAGNAGFIRAVLDGVAVSGNLNFGSSGATTSTGWVFSPAVSAAAHTMKLQGAVNQAGPTFAMIEAAMQVFQLGS